MSGIVGIFNLDRAPVDQRLLRRMTDFMTFRGPDAQEIWVGGHVGLGHALLKTTFEAEHEHQPFTFDGQVWIVADARVDGQRDLISKLESHAHEIIPGTTDVELILRAYQVWGEACVEHLLGDFAFAVWDGPRERLFCARDHMGVKPFYYAHRGSTFIFSNTLDCVRLHPAVSDKLNDLAIADFVLFASNLENSTTAFADILRIAPAHAITCSPKAYAKRCFWTLPIEDPIYYREDCEYTDRFLALLREAVSDRLRTQAVSVFMSGGLDSTGIAAVALELLRGGAEDPVHAFTSVFDSLMPDSERHYAGMAARYLGIPIKFYALDRKTAWAELGSRSLPEPACDLLEDSTGWREQYRAMAAHSRVALYGEGPDNALLYEWQSHLTWLASQKRWARLARDLGKHLLHHKRVPLLPTVPRMIRDRQRQRDWGDATFPGWLEESLVKRLRLRERWRDANTQPLSLHPVRPKAHSSFLGPIWQDVFEGLEPPFTSAPIEVRHPYVDIRLLRFLLRVPAVPWCRKKQLLRRAFRGLLPEVVRARPKTPLAKKPLFELIGRKGPPPVALSPMLSSYGHLRKLEIGGRESMADLHTQLRFAALSHWLNGLDGTTRITKENYDGRTEDFVARSAT